MQAMREVYGLGFRVRGFRAFISQAGSSTARGTPLLFVGFGFWT